MREINRINQIVLLSLSALTACCWELKDPIVQEASEEEDSSSESIARADDYNIVPGTKISFDTENRDDTDTAVQLNGVAGYRKPAKVTGDGSDTDTDVDSDMDTDTGTGTTTDVDTDIVTTTGEDRNTDTDTDTTTGEDTDTDTSTEVDSGTDADTDTGPSIDENDFKTKYIVPILHPILYNQLVVGI